MKMPSQDIYNGSTPFYQRRIIPLLRKNATTCAKFKAPHYSGALYRTCLVTIVTPTQWNKGVSWYFWWF